MRILFDEGVHNMRNKGNNAMLQAAIDRVRQYWPDASCYVITFAPHLTRLYFPGVHPVSPDNLQPLHRRFDRLYWAVPRSIWWLLLESRERIWTRRSIKSWRQLSLRSEEPGNSTLDGAHLAKEAFDEAQYQSAIREGLARYDLLICTGGGVFYDYDAVTALKMLNRLEVAIGLGMPTIMVGQGIGAIDNPRLRLRAKEVLPKIDFIGVRNRQIGQPTLYALDVPVERIRFTGDDAIEMAYTTRPRRLGTGLGVSIRVAGYTQIDENHLKLLRSVLQQAARTQQAPLIAIPTSSHHEESDSIFLKQLLAGYENTLIGWRMLDTPQAIIQRVARCRLLISATYHGAIFALAQGIPVIVLAKSTEYTGKLAELADEFSPGCWLFHLDEEKLAEQLPIAINQAWSSAEEIRPVLLEIAARLVQLQRSAYRSIYDIVTTKQQGVLHSQ